jgi:putative membrane protein
VFPNLGYVTLLAWLPLDAAKDPSPDVWKFHAHPAVWLLVVGLAVGYAYTVRVVGPTVVAPGQRPVSRRKVMSFVAGLLLLWVATDYPMHELSDSYLYSVHMLQHMMLSYFAPPLLLMAIPEWFGRLLVGSGRVYRVVRFASRPVAAAVIFTAWLVITHIPGVVNAATTVSWLHYTMHAVLVLTALLMWLPVCGPFPEMRMQPAGMMLYLFAQSFVPTVPAAWLTFAEGVVYKSYDHSVRVWHTSILDDQQYAGALMKIGGSVFLWVIMTVLFFRRLFNGKTWDEGQKFRKVTDADRPVSLTYEDVTAVFEQSTPVAESRN